MIVSNGEALDFAPQALGEVTPTLSNGYYYARQGLSLATRFATYAALYRAQPAIATLVDKVANAAARLTVKVWDTTPESGRVQDKDSEYARLIANPCTEMSPFNFWRWTVSTYEVYGEAFWYKQRASRDSFGRPTGKVVNLLPMHPSRVMISRDDDGNTQYVFTLGVASTGLLTAPADDVVAFLRYNPENLMRGMSRLEPLRSTLLNEDAARRANASWWERGARPSVVLTHPGELSEPAMDRIKSKFDARHAGADNMGGTAVLQEGMTATVVQLNAEEMQYIESRKLNMQEACMVYDVPPPVVHILDHATFSNITEQMRSMYRDTMSPRLEDLESTIDHFLLPEFFAPGTHETEFDMSEVLRGDFETRADKAVTLRQSGIATGNEAREIVGIARSEDAEMDKLYANSALGVLRDSAAIVASDPAAQIKAQADAIGALIRAGADPEQAAAMVGLDGLTFPNVPVTVRIPETDAAGLEGGGAAPSTDAEKALMRKVLRQVGRVKASRKDIRGALVAEHEKALGEFFAEQRSAVKAATTRKASGAFDPSAWDGDLASILHTLSKASAQAIGQKVAADLGGEYSADDIAAWLESNSQDTAKRINKATADQIAAALEAANEDEDPEDTIDAVFDGQVAARSNQISLTRVALVAGLAALVAARQSGAQMKTWATGGNPRSTHAQLNGETVPLGELFSNGMNGPGDYSAGADEVAGCNCDLVFTGGSSEAPALSGQEYYAQIARGER